MTTPTLTLDQALAAALRLHQAGRLAEAERIYRGVLARRPDHAQALHLLGVLVHQSGNHEAAVELIRRAIAVDPGLPDAHYNLGTALGALGRMEEAAAAFARAVSDKPGDPHAHNNLANALKETGRLQEAVTEYRRAIELDGGYAQAHANLGGVLASLGQTAEALIACRAAIELDPASAEAHTNLGNALKDDGRSDEALAEYERAVALNPGHAEAHNNIGNVLHERGQTEQAMAAYRQAIALRPAYAQAHVNLANSLRAQGRLDDAIAAYRRAIALKPADAQTHSNLGAAMSDLGHIDEAIGEYRMAIALDAHLANAHWNLALALLARGDFAQGWAEYEWRWRCPGMAARDFAQPEGHAARSQPAYCAGSGEKGEGEASEQGGCPGDRHRGRENPHPNPLPEYREREKMPKAIGLWDGAPLHGRRILLHADQGFGDTLQFIRYLPLVAERGGQIIVECQPELRRLLQMMPAAQSGAAQTGAAQTGAAQAVAAPAVVVQTVVARGEVLPDFDVHCPLMTLPRLLGTTLENIPHDVPYVEAAAADNEKWAARLAEAFAPIGDHSHAQRPVPRGTGSPPVFSEQRPTPGSTGFQPVADGTQAGSLCYTSNAAVHPITVGVVWAGSGAHSNDRNRSMPPHHLAPLAEFTGVRFVSLQKGPAQPQPPGMYLLDVTEDLHDFADTAALIANLDLVISVDTAVAHLAGAMGKPVWTLLPFAADWRWLLNRDDSPWYPTMRLFRQPAIGDWDSVIERVAAELRELANRR